MMMFRLSTKAMKSSICTACDASSGGHARANGVGAFGPRRGIRTGLGKGGSAAPAGTGGKNDVAQSSTCAPVPSRDGLEDDNVEIEDGVCWPSTHCRPPSFSLLRSERNGKFS